MKLIIFWGGGGFSPQSTPPPPHAIVFLLNHFIYVHIFTGALAIQRHCAMNTNTTVKRVAANKKHKKGKSEYIKLCWASKETYHIFVAMLTTIRWIKINHIWIQIHVIYNIPYYAHLNKRRVAYMCAKREKISVKSQNALSKITETALCSPHTKDSLSKLTIHSISLMGYVIVNCILCVVYSE